MSSFFKDLREFIWLRRHGFQAAEYIRENDRISMHACGWRANGSGRMKSARDAVAYLEGAAPEQWRQIYCGMTPFLVSDRGNVRLIDGSEPKMFLANGRYQIAYKPEDVHPSRRGRRGGMAHKKRVYRSVLVAMAFLDFKKGDEEHEVHHVNGYRTDDRLVNLMVLTHDEHTRIHSMGPCGLTAPVDQGIAAADLLAEAKPAGKLKLRRMKKKALECALAEPKKLPAAASKDDSAAQQAAPSAKQEARTTNGENANAHAGEGTAEQLNAPSKPTETESNTPNEQAKPDRTAITPAEAPLGTYAFAPLPVLDETGIFTTPDAPEVVAAKQAEEEAREQKERQAQAQAEAKAAELAAIPARGEHKAEEKSTLQAAAEQGLAEVSEKLEGTQVRSGVRAQESLNGEGMSKSAKRRASKKRAEQRRAEAKAILEQAAAEAEREKAAELDEDASAEAPTAIAETPSATKSQPAIAQAAPPKDDAQTPRDESAGITPLPCDDAEGKAAHGEKLQKPELDDKAKTAEDDPERQRGASEGKPEIAPKPEPKQSPTPKAGIATPKTQAPKAGQKPGQSTDWAALRENLAHETAVYVKAARKLSEQEGATDKQFAIVARPVYKAFKPFLTCNDEVTTFDVCLTCIRLIAQEADAASKNGQAELPKSTHSLLGNLQKLLKTSVRKLMHNDEIVAACTEEMVREEAAKPLYSSLGTNPFQHCVNIVGSKKEAAAKRSQNQPKENAASKPKRKKQGKSDKHASEKTGAKAQDAKAKQAENAAAEPSDAPKAAKNGPAEAEPNHDFEPKASPKRETELAPQADSEHRNAKGNDAPAEVQTSPGNIDSCDQQTTDNLREGNAPSTKRRNARRRSRTKRAKEIMEAKD